MKDKGKTPGDRKKPAAGRAAARRGKYKTTLPNGNWMFKKALNEITGQSSEAKALPVFKKLFALHYREIRRASRRADDEAKVESVLQDNLAIWRRDGMSDGDVQRFKTINRSLPRRGARPSKRG